MAERATRKAGLPKNRHSDPKVQRSFDAIIERLEVLDGLRGDSLDKAVTWRDLSDSGFTVTFGGTRGGPLVTDSPSTGGTAGGGSGPTVGPAAPPENLVAQETFLAILLTWDNPSFNLQHIEVWRSAVDNLSTAIMIGTTVSPQYLDYVGANASYYYWVRAVGTDGTYSAYNDTQGTLGTTGIDPSAFEGELTIAASNLDAVLAARIDLIDSPTTGLVDRITVAEGDIVAAQSDISTLQTDYSTLLTTVNGNTTNISANASLISTAQTNISTLTNDLNTLEGDVAGNTSAITVNSQQILELQASVGALDAEGGQSWEFDADVEGFTATNATATWNSGGFVVFSSSGADPQLISPTFTNISGSLYTQVVMRVRLTSGAPTWEGGLYYKTTGGWLGPVTIADPSLALGTWTTLTWNCSNETGWLNGGITQIRFDLESSSPSTFEVDWIQIARMSTTALSQAISGLDVRVTAAENDISANSTAITALESSVNDVDSGVVANASAISALTTTVNNNTTNISANALDITALESTVNNPTTGVSANATAIGQLEADVTTLDGVTTASATDITQLVARISGTYASIVNPLTTAGEAFGTTFSVQNYNDVGGRSNVAGRVDTNGNQTRYVYKYDGSRFKVEPRAIYEIQYSVYHNRPTNAGSFYMGMFGRTEAGVNGTVNRINNGAIIDTSTNPYWFNTKNTIGANQWLDVTCYLLGSDVDPAVCPDQLVNGATSFSGAGIFYDGIQVGATNPYVELRFLNFNTSPTYGDDTTTTLYVTDLQVRRIDSEAANYSALEVQASATANDVGDLQALYAVKVELNSGGDPYVSGFGLATEVIDGTASSAFGIRADQFFIQHPSTSSSTSAPFTVGTTGDGTATVGIQGGLIVNGTIRGTSILANTIGADRLNVNQLSAISADMGTLTSGLIRTAASPAWRVEIEDTASTTWPIWYGSNAKSAGNGLFYVTDGGDVIVKGLLDAGMIKQSYFTPGNLTSPFRIACEYPSTPSTYSGGIYTGKKAQLFPRLSFSRSPDYPVWQGDYLSPELTFIGPLNTSSSEYSRLGSTSELVHIDVSASFSAVTNADEFTSGFETIKFRLTVQYQYNSEGWSDAFYTDIVIYDGFVPQGSGRRSYSGSGRFPQSVVTRGTSFNTLRFRLKIEETSTPSFGLSSEHTLQTVALIAQSPNFGIADVATQTGVPGPIGSMPDFPVF